MGKLKPIEEQVVVLMGASSGIGRLAAHRFAERGARVIVSARDEEDLELLVDEIRQRGGEARAVPADVRDFEQTRAVAQAAVDSYGRLDTWVHLAAVSIYATFEDTTLEEFETILDTNLMGQIHGAKAALPYIRQEGRGALIHISSIEAERALPYQSAYAASKHGVKGFLEALRLELQHEGVPISVTNIMPATINTPLFNRARTKIGTKPMGLPPIYEPDVVVDAILEAAEKPVRDVYAGGGARVMAIMQKLSPRLMDALILRTAFEGQRTEELKSASAPDALSGPMAGRERIYGDFGAQAMGMSPSTRLQTADGLKVGLAALAVGATVAVANRFLTNGNS